MLEDLTIKDFALIDSSYIEFNKGFTVLSGETGAGKSILIGALSFLLGGKTDIQQIRAGKPEASVTGTFFLADLPVRPMDNEDDEPENALEWLKQHGIQIENNRVILRRYIRQNGKSAAWINDTQVIRQDLQDFAAFLVDIHGQHEHQSLMKVQEHRKFLDSRAGIVNDVKTFTQNYAMLVSKRAELEQYSMSESERLRKIDMYTFAVNEINELKLKENEDEALEQEAVKLESFEKLYSEIDGINALLSNDENGVIDLLKKVRRQSSNAQGMDKNLIALDTRVESAFYELSDIADEFSSYLNTLVFDPQRLEEVHQRLSAIYSLKKKYASSINAPLSEVFEFCQKAQKFLDDNSDGNNYKTLLESQIKVLEKKVLEMANVLSQKRIACAKVLSGEVNEILSKLGMKGTNFVVSIKDKSGTELVQKCGPYGKDDIEFLISANPGNPPLPLAKIASGGELSRVMLALKTIFAQSTNDTVETLIFDEIDTGIGGEVAVAVGSHIKNLSKKRQIFCITHLASIAVYADNQIKIAKSVSDSITSSNVYPVEGEDRVNEIARMLSGDSKDQQSLEHARVLLQKYSGS